VFIAVSTTHIVSAAIVTLVIRRIEPVLPAAAAPGPAQ
jgi:hypothetical protein